MNPEIAQAQAVHLAFVDDELLTKANEIAKEKIKYEKQKLDEVADYGKRQIREAQERINKLNEERMRAEIKRIEDENERVHMQWRRDNPRLAEEEDLAIQKKHQHELELIKMKREAAEKAATTTAKVAVGAVVGGVVAFFM